MKWSSLLSPISLGALVVVLVFGSLAGCAAMPTLGSSAPTVEIAYLNHPPVKAVLVDVDKVLAGYGDKVKVSRVIVDEPAGEEFLKSKGITERTVLGIWINGKLDYKAGDKAVKFFSFPVGRGTQVTAAGNWDLPDFEAALRAAIGS
ncbi:MAG: hypothetical protein ACYC4L_20680 [Chloroflexota bacterium]